MATTWNPADVLNVTLSGGNLTATANAGGQIAARAHGVGHSTGKWYLEYSNLASAGGGGFGLGLLSDTLSANDGGHIGVFTSGAFNVPGANGGSFSGSVLGHTFGLAVDFTAGFAWVTEDGVNWVGFNGGGTASPITGANGASLSGIPAGLMFPICAMFNTPSSATLNTGDQTFAFAVPAGFTAWDSSPVPTDSFGTIIN